MSKRINSNIFDALEAWAPKHLAYDWDNVGLQVGSLNREVKKIMITLDVLETVVDEAIENDVDLIIAHHPLLFKGLKQVDVDTPTGKIIEKLIANKISVYAAHTNLDITNGGVNDILCKRLGIETTDHLIQTDQEKLYKIAVYVPNSHADAVREVLGDAGAGHIGDYSHCTFQTAGKGAFKPLEGTNPYIGKVNILEFVDEVKLETIVQEQKLSEVIKQMIAVHPYEEVAYDIIPLANSGTTVGIGKIGHLQDEMKLRAFAEYVKETLNMSAVRVTGDLTKVVQKVAVLGGSGEKYIEQAIAKKADVYITGDMTFHNAQDAWVRGLAVIDAGHYIEYVMKQETKQYLEAYFSKDDPDTRVEVIISETNTDPFQFV